MFDGELFEDFVLLYRLLHVSRFEVADGAPVSTCRMEKLAHRGHRGRRPRP